MTGWTRSWGLDFNYLPSSDLLLPQKSVGVALNQHLDLTCSARSTSPRCSPKSSVHGTVNHAILSWNKQQSDSTDKNNLSEAYSSPSESSIPPVLGFHCPRVLGYFCCFNSICSKIFLRCFTHNFYATKA